VVFSAIDRICFYHHRHHPRGIWSIQTAAVNRAFSFVELALAQLDSFAQAPLDFGFVRLGKLMANALSRQIARELMQIQPQFEPLLACHLAVPRNLEIQSGFRFHANNLGSKAPSAKGKIRL
jgi:hypothetical protein